jgi:large subunit ribosomal protein L9
MKVILKQDFKSLGKKDQIIDVNDGYARNFLIPKGIAVEATPSAVNEAKSKQKAAAHRKQVELEEARALAKKISELTVVVSSKAGASGKLFGSITAKDIVNELKKQHKISIDKKMLILPEPIRTLGITDVEFRLYAGVTGKLKVKVEDGQ